MRAYADFRDEVADGDAIGCKDRRFWSIVIRVLTGESLNHVAWFLWLADGLWIAEMHERYGFTMTPASQWFERRATSELFWIKAPSPVRGNPAVREATLRLRADNPPYSRTTLVLVWISQLFKRNMHGLLVCSTALQAVWERAGFRKFVKLADPGDFPFLGQASIPVTWRIQNES